MAAILLTSEKFVKSVTSINDNLAGKFLQPSMREAQDIGLRGIVGDALLAKLKSLVADGSINAPANATYKALADQAQYYLAYTTVVELLEKVSYKVTNFGVVKTGDEKAEVASAEEIARNKYYWQSKADACCLDLQNWLLENRSSLPELTENTCYRIKTNLHSAASCGIFLGGARGKGTVPGRCRK